MVVLLEGSRVTTEELWSCIRGTSGFLVTSLTKALLPRLLSLARRRNFFHLRLMEATVFLGTFSATKMFWYPSPDWRLNTILSLSSHGLVFALTCTANCGTYIDRCVPFQIMSNQFILPQVVSNKVVETSQGWSMETGCTWAQFRVSKQRVSILM